MLFFAALSFCKCIKTVVLCATNCIQCFAFVQFGFKFKSNMAFILLKKVLSKISKYTFAWYLGYETHKEFHGSNNHNEQNVAIQPAPENREISNLEMLSWLILGTVLAAAMVVLASKVFSGLKKRAEKKVMRALAA